MDKELYTDDFEQLLKEQADRFTMRPTKRVWHSIYNDLHPARKWPSVAISLLLVISMLLLGYLNTNNGRQGTNTAVANALASNSNNHNGSGKNSKQTISNQSATTTAQSTVNNTVINFIQDISKAIAALNTIMGNVNANTASSNAQSGTNNDINTDNIFLTPKTNGQSARRTSSQSSVKAIRDKNSQNNGSTTYNNGAAYNSNDVSEAETDVINNDDNSVAFEGTSAQAEADIIFSKTTTPLSPSMKEEADVAKNILSGETDNDIIANLVKDKANPTIADADKNKGGTLTDLEKGWIENYAFHNKPKQSMWSNRVSWQVYVAPGFSYRTLFENTIAEGRTGLQNLVTNPFARQAGLENNVEHKPGPSLEVGGALIYDLSKKWQIQVGAQANYSSYIIWANKINHPINTNITINNFFTGSLDAENHSASISNTPGSNISRLKNYSVQISMPIGFNYKLAGKDDLKFYATVNVQPSWVVYAESLLPSSNFLFYVDNNTKQGKDSYIRRFNVAMGIGTLASYRMGDFTFRAGPQIRYQLLTTNNHKFTMGEKMYNIALMLGISKRF